MEEWCRWLSSVQGSEERRKTRASSNTVPNTLAVQLVLIEKRNEETQLPCYAGEAVARDALWGQFLSRNSQYWKHNSSKVETVLSPRYDSSEMCVTLTSFFPKWQLTMGGQHRKAPGMRVTCKALDVLYPSVTPGNLLLSSQMVLGEGEQMSFALI